MDWKPSLVASRLLRMERNLIWGVDAGRRLGFIITMCAPLQGEGQGGQEASGVRPSSPKAPPDSVLGPFEAPQNPRE